MGRNVSGQLHNKEVKIVVMSVQTSFPQFLKKNAVSPPGANKHTVLCSQPGFPESHCLPFRKSMMWCQTKGHYDPSQRVLSSTFVLTLTLPLGCRKQEKYEGQGIRSARILVQVCPNPQGCRAPPLALAATYPKTVRPLPLFSLHLLSRLGPAPSSTHPTRLWSQ